MFTGIIENLGEVSEVREVASSGPSDSGRHLVVRTGYPDLTLGESVAVNGACLTVIEFDAKGSASFFVSSETLDRTSLGRLGIGSRVNLERALLPTTRLSGHYVQGHVDGVGRFVGAQALRNGSFDVRFELPAGLERYCVEKGSIALSGVSLTVNAVEDCTVRIMLIPHTWEHTTFSDLQPGDPVNIEVDILAKYVERFLTCPPRN